MIGSQEAKEITRESQRLEEQKEFVDRLIREKAGEGKDYVYVDIMSDFNNRSVKDLKALLRARHYEVIQDREVLLIRW